MSDLVRNPEDRFSHNEAQMLLVCLCIMYCAPHVITFHLLKGFLNVTSYMIIKNKCTDHLCCREGRTVPLVVAAYIMSLVMRKLAFCICENTDADQLRGDRETDQRLCFRYINSAIPLLSKSEISSLLPSSVAVQPGMCRTWSETPKTDFLTTRL